jgi:Rieske Fe-S protein
MSDEELSGPGGISRRDFIKATTGIVGGLIGAILGLPAIGYLLDPAFKAGAKEGWIAIGKLDDMQVGKPYPFSFTRTQVNGWERTSTAHGGFAIRKSDNPQDILILNSRCTHLGCTVNWKDEAQAFVCPCHDAKFSKDGVVLGGPPPRPLDRYTQFRVDDAGVVEIYYKEA